MIFLIYVFEQLNTFKALLDSTYQVILAVLIFANIMISYSALYIDNTKIEPILPKSLIAIGIVAFIGSSILPNHDTIRMLIADKYDSMQVNDNIGSQYIHNYVKDLLKEMPK